MKTPIYILLIVLMCGSCTSKDQLEIAFENQLPPADLEVLDLIVSAYNELIKTVYDGDVDGFLVQIQSGQAALDIDHKEAYCKLVKLFDESTLAYKSKKVKYDTVYLSDDGHIVKIEQAQDRSTGGLQLDEEIEILAPDETMEQKAEKIRGKGYWRDISASSFTAALEEIVGNNKELNGYIGTKNSIHHINHQY